MFHNAAIQNIYICIPLYFKTSSMCISNAVKNQSGIEFKVDALFDSLYAVVEVHTNFVLIHFGRQSHCVVVCGDTYITKLSKFDY